MLEKLTNLLGLTSSSSVVEPEIEEWYDCKYTCRIAGVTREYLHRGTDQEGVWTGECC